MQDYLVVALLITLLFTGLLLIAYFINRRLSQLAEKQKPPEELLQIIKMLQEGSKEDRKVLLDNLQRNTQAMNERLDNAAKVIANLQRNVGEMSEIGRSMKDLQEFLRSPKLRGNIGEQVLRELLGQMLPKQSFHLQYAFKSGVIVDAAIKTAAGIIPVDAKFPMENYRKMAKAQNEAEKKTFQKEFIRDIKKHIDDIAKKYILTEEGTIDYALMYIPAEAVYYEVVNSDTDLIDFSHKLRVLPVSPTTFYAYLRAILMSFEGQKIEARAREILQAIRAVQKDYARVDESLGVLGKHLGNAYNMMAQVVTNFSHLGQRITATQSLGGDMKEVDEIESSTVN